MPSVSSTVEGISTDNIAPAVFIKLGPIEGNVYYVADTYKPYTIDGNDYTNLGSFLSMTDFQDEVRVNNGELGIVFSGIPSEVDYIDLILNTKIKGAPIEIFRGFIEANGNLAGGTVTRRYKGIITNFALDEDREQFGMDTVTRVTLTCSNINRILENNLSGRKTNGAGMKKYFPNDLSWDRTQTLMNTQFDFGKNYPEGTTGSAGASGGRNGAGNTGENEQR